MIRSLAVAVAVVAFSAAAESKSVEGMGRITVQGGYRYNPNGYFAGKAAEAGTPYTYVGPGGAQGAVSFGFGALEWLEVAIDGFVAWEQFKVDGVDTFNSVSYGALLGPRLTKVDFPFEGLVPYFGVEFGPTLSLISATKIQSPPEKLQTGFMVCAGLTWRFMERWGLTFDVRYLYARQFAAEISGMSVGGIMFSLGVSMFIPAPPKSERETLTF